MKTRIGRLSGTSVPGVTCVLTLLMLMIHVALVGSARAEDNPPPGEIWPDHICDKDLVCTGDVSEGICLAAGTMCINSSCISQTGCDYAYDWNCVAGVGRCKSGSEAMLIEPACVAKCVNVAWNACECQCQIGDGGVSSGIYWQCFTLANET